MIYAYYRKSGKVQKSIKKRIIDNQGENNINFNCQGGKKVTHFSFFSLKGKGKGKPLSGVRLFTTPWTAAYQAPLSMGFSRQEYWSGVPLPSPVSLPVLSLILNIAHFFFHLHRNENRCTLRLTSHSLLN